MIRTEELVRRPSRPPYYMVENKAMAAVMEAMSAAPETLLQTLVETALKACWADSAGVSVVETGDGPEMLRTQATAGRFAYLAGGSSARAGSPYGFVLDQNAPQLFAYPERHFDFGAQLHLPIVEALLVPFHLGGIPIGTVWLLSHTPARQFDREDVRILTSLARVASINHQVTTAMRSLEGRRTELARLVEERSKVLRGFLNTAATGLTRVSRDLKYRLANASYAQLAGRPLEEIIGHSLVDVMGAEAVAAIRPYFERALCGERVEFELEVPFQASGSRWLHVVYNPDRDEQGAVIGWVASLTDITDHKRAEDALRQKDQLLRAIVTSLPGAAIFVVDRELRYVLAEGDALRKEGLEPSSFVGKAVAEAPGPGDEHNAVAEYRNVLAGGSFLIEHRINKSHYLSRGTPIRSEQGEIVAALAIAIDITERKRTEEALNVTKERLRLFIEFAPASIAMFDREMCYLAVSRRWKTDFQLKGEIVGRCHYEVFPEIPERWKVVHQRCLAGEFLSSVCDRFERADGTIQWLSWEAIPWRTDAGAIGGILIASEEISARKAAEDTVMQLNASLEQQVAERTRALQDRKERLRAILDSTVDAIINIDYEGIIHEVNPATEKLFGYSASELIGQNVRILMPAPYRGEHHNYIADYLRTGIKKVLCIGREVTALRKDGSTFPADLAVNEIPHLKLFTGIIRDISRRKELERDIVEVAALEQQRICQDLHDTVSQELTALNIQAADFAEIVAKDNATAVQEAKKMTEGLRRCQVHLRAVMRGLLPVAIDAEGLMFALAELAERTQQQGKVNCTFTCADHVAISDSLTANHLFLIAQEAVHNAVKHANAQSIQIGLKLNDLLELSVTDDGTGLVETKRLAQGNAGLGLRIMRNRADLIGATLSIGSNKPTGTRVLCTLPRLHHAKKQDRPA